MTESFGQLWNHSGIITMNEDCIIQSVDRACSAIFGHPLETMLGQNINILIPSPYKEQHDSYVRNYFRTGERHILGQSRLVEGLTADNQVFPLRLNVNEVIVDDQRIFVGVVDRLEELGHATRGPNPADRRGVVVTPAPASSRKALSLILPMVGDIDAALDGFDEEQQAVIAEYLDRVVAALRPHTTSVHSGTNPPATS